MCAPMCLGAQIPYFVALREWAREFFVDLHTTTFLKAYKTDYVKGKMKLNETK